MQNFLTALENLGATDKERAKKLGISLRAFSEYKAKRLPRFGKIIINNPVLAEAIAEDAKVSQKSDEVNC